MSVSVLNTDSGLSGKTLVNAESNQTITGTKTFDLDPNPPFAVSSGSAVVPNLDADKVDGYEGSQLAVLAENETVSGTWAFTPGLKERGRTALIGEWTDVSFSAGNFTGNNSMTWTVASGDQATFQYMQIGKTLFVQFNIVTSTVGGTPSTALQIAIPASAVPSKTTRGTFRYSDNGTLGMGEFLITASGTVIQLFKDDGSNWTAAADTTTVGGLAVFEIN